MSKVVIWSIIVIMSLSLIGVGMIQYFWIERAVALDEKNFNDKVTIALSNVKKQLQNDAESAAEQYYYNENLASETEPNNQLEDRIRQLERRTEVLNPEVLLEGIDIQNLDKYIRDELTSKNIALRYEYGVYSQSQKAYIIVNGNYIATIGDTTKSSNVAAIKPLTDAEFRISLFEDELGEPGHLNLYFPGKKRFLWSNVSGILLSSIIFTGLILFCFSFTVYIIFLQKKVSKMKTDFINNMTHEFKTPIATISLAADSIVSPTVLPNQEKITRFINIIRQENKRMLNQVEKVLQMAQIEKENVQLKWSEVNIHELIEPAVVNAGLKVMTKGGTITTRLQASQPVVSGDATHLASIINNLLDNAEKYTPENPNIIVTTRNVGKGVEVSVEDNGVGISRDAQKNIFEKFYRVHTGNLHDVKGFGLGLSYVKAMVEAHNGRVSVKSEPGKGSTFTVYLPFQQPV